MRNNLRDIPMPTSITAWTLTLEEQRLRSDRSGIVLVVETVNIFIRDDCSIYRFPWSFDGNSKRDCSGVYIASVG